MSAPAYDKAYFFAKLTAIPDEKWTTGIYVNAKGQCCASGHCGGYQMSEEWEHFIDLRVGQEGTWPSINDGDDPRYQQSTPKARILAALADLP